MLFLQIVNNYACLLYQKDSHSFSNPFSISLQTSDFITKNLKIE